MDNKKRKYFYEFKVEDGEVERTFAISKPLRKEKEAVDLFFSSTVTKYTRAGILPRAAYKTILDNIGGTISEKDEQEFEEEKKKLNDLVNSLGELNLVADENKTKEELIKQTELKEEFEKVQKKIVEFQTYQLKVYENTAESKALVKTITWLLLYLSYEKIGDQYVPLFKGKDIEEKLDEYEEVQDNEFLMNVLSRIHYLVTLWFIGRINDEESFAKYDEENTIKDKE